MRAVHLALAAMLSVAAVPALHAQAPWPLDAPPPLPAALQPSAAAPAAELRMPSTRRLLTGMGVGMLIGAGTGALVGYLDASDCSREEDFCVLTRGEVAGILAVAGAGMGAAAGGLLTMLFPGRPADPVAITPSTEGVRLEVRLSP